MGNSQCKPCQPDHHPLPIPQSTLHNFTTLQQSFIQYRARNMLQFYSERVQRNVQKLFFFQQQHVCDLILGLSENKTDDIRDRVLQEVESINLQQLDHLSIVKNMNMKSMQSLTHLAYEEEKQRTYNIRPTKSKFRLHILSDFNQKEGLRIINKELLIEKMPTNKINNLIKANQFFIVATVGCFQKQSVLTPTKLPSGKTLLYLFLQKILAANNKYQHPILVVLIVNHQCEDSFDREMMEFESQLEVNSSRVLRQLAPTFRWEKVVYRPCYPCVNYERKIQLHSQGIMFNNNSGDLIGFISSNSRIRDLLKVYSFMQMANLCNIMETVADKQILILLLQNQCDVVAPIITNEKIGPVFETLAVNRYFVDQVYSKRSDCQSYKLAHTFYIRSNIFQNRSMYYQNLLSKRIRYEVFSGYHKIIHFVRTFQDILYAPLTVFVIMPNNAYCVENQEIFYSNYCKSLLELQGTKEDQMVEICPMILFANRELISQVAADLNQKRQHTFPIIIKKAKAIKGSRVRKSNI